MDTDEAALWLGIRKHDVPRFASYLWRCIVTVFMAYSMGLLTFLGIPGFIRAGDIQQVKEQQLANTASIHDLNRRSIENNLMLTLQTKCKAVDKTFAIQRMNDLQFEYHELTGIYWRQPNCSELN